MKSRLRRRGVDHGQIEPAPRTTSWPAGEPGVLRSLVRPGGLRPSLDLVRALREGADLPRLRPAPRGFRFTGLSQNTEDPLELHKLHVKAAGVKRELYVKVNWLSTHPGDASLRLRFSFGAEIIDDWLHDPADGRASLRLCEALFPETTWVTRKAPAIRRVIGATPRFMQPIVYANAPDGGALFHHDVVPGQAGVLYTQLAGRTAWLTLPRHRLARHVRDLGFRLTDPPSDRVDRLINATSSFTRRLAADGWMFVLDPGDAILLPCEPARNAAWHSVFTVGRGPNLALSMGFTVRNRPAIRSTSRQRRG